MTVAKNEMVSPECPNCTGLAKVRVTEYEPATAGTDNIATASTITRVNISFRFIGSLPFLRMGLAYGNLTRKLAPNVPPVYEPLYFSITRLPELPALDGNVTVVMTKPPPGTIFPSDCGSGAPVAPPRVAPVKVTFCAVP